MGDDPLLSNPVVPVASDDDARETMAALLPRLAKGSEFVAVHVIEKAGGAPDKASVEQLEDRAAVIFEVVEALAADAGVSVQTDLRYHTDVVDGVFAAAADHDASAVVFVPRAGSRWIELLTGDVSRDLVKRAKCPVVVLPSSDE